ncbi:MAG: PspC domain-containing protein [Woeseiaceae bacterium]
MSRQSWNIDHGPLRGFYRDRENGWIFGVCAGIAERFNFRLGVVRIIAVIMLLVFFWMTAAVYLGAAFLIREKPLVYSGRSKEHDFWRRYHDDRWSRS